MPASLGKCFTHANCAPETLPSSHCLPARKAVETGRSGGAAPYLGLLEAEPLALASTHDRGRPR